MARARWDATEENVTLGTRKAGRPGTADGRSKHGQSGGEWVAMQTTGHETRSVFDRYHIVSLEDLQEGSRKLAGPSHGHSRADCP